MSGEVAVVQNSRAAQEYMTKMLPGLTALAQRKYDPNSWARTVVLAIVESAELTKCLSTAAGKSSLYHALKFAATTGLSMNPQEGKCALIAYGGKIQYQVMKNGLIDLALADPKVKNFRTLTVREHDDFTIRQTLDGDEFDFSPNTTDRGEIIGFFAALKMEDGPSYVKYMTKAEVEKHRDQYSAMFKSKNKANSPWTHSFEGMGEKTIAKALLRTTSISSDLDILVGTDDKAEAEMIDITPEKSLEEQVVEEQPVIEAEKVEKAEEKPAEPVEPADTCEPPTEDGGLTEKQVGKIAGMLHASDIHKDGEMRAKVSEILGYSPVIGKLEYVPKALAKGLYDKLDELNKAVK